jgi:ADP-ribose pyrophosphatase YjhB (NUDIX family)
MTHINKLIDELDEIIKNPNSGLPEEVFLFTSRITPIVNVDLIIRNNNNETLLTWRGGDYYSPGWHIPGGIVRYKESMHERINHVAKIELGTEVEFSSSPIMVNEVIRSPERLNRGHFVSFLFECELKKPPIQQEKYGEYKWFKECPTNIIPVHTMYKDVINGKKSKKEYSSDFGTSYVVIDNT